MEKLVLIDGNSLINRAFYAMPLLTTKDGIYTNAVYGFMNMFFKTLSEEKPTYVVVAFDVKAPTFRHKMFAEYKGTRKPMPEELRPQIPLLKELLIAMGITVMEKPGSEADDIIGTIAKNTDVKTIIITGDKDSFQLVDEQTEVHFTKRGVNDVDVYNYNNFKEKTTIDPIQIIDLKALMGDSSDNIPGIPGVGEKTALSLINTYGTVENLYEHTDELKGKLQEKVLLNKDSAFLSKTLATIDCNCGVSTDLNGMKFSMPFSASIKQRFKELEFRSLYKRDELFINDETNEEKSVSHIDVEKINVSDLSANDYLSLGEPIAFTINKNSVNLSDGKKELFYKIQETLLDDGFSLSETLYSLQPLITGKKRLLLYDKKGFKHFVFKTTGILLSAPSNDLSIIKYLPDFSGREQALVDVLDEYSLSLDTPASSCINLYNTLFEKLKEENTTSLYTDVELPLADVLYDMETAGFKIDYNALCVVGEKYKSEIEKLEQEIRELACEPTLNVNSPKQLGDVLFEKLKLGKGKKNKTGYSTTVEVLESLETAHPIVPLILRHRGMQKIASTYIEGFKPLVDKRTGLIHTSFNQTVTATGRLSSKEPNLQNIPVRDDESKEIRKLFVPKSDDRILISADYSQIELRLLASFSECTSLINAFNNGKDIHASTASKVFSVPLEEVTSHMRSSAKAVNFGIIYGISEYGLAKNLKTEPYKAREYINAYFKEYPEVKTYMDKNVEFAKENGYAKTVLGRRRYIRELSSSNYNLRQFGERVAMNMPLQGSSADIIKLAMLGVHKRIKEEKLKSELILQIHDELIVDAFKDEQSQIEKIVKEEMENALKLSVELTVGIGSGSSWFDAK